VKSREQAGRVRAEPFYPNAAVWSVNTPAARCHSSPQPGM